jgi:hypothetical protein
MDPLPFLQEPVSARDHFGEQPPYVRPLHSDARHQLGLAFRSQKVHFRLALGPDDVDMRRLMIERIDDKPETVGPMDDNHGKTNRSVGFRKGAWNLPVARRPIERRIRPLGTAIIG